MPKISNTRAVLSPYYGKVVCVIGKPNIKERHNRRLFVKPLIKYCLPDAPPQVAKEKHFDFKHYLNPPVNLDTHIHHMWVDQQVIRNGHTKYELFQKTLGTEMYMGFAGKVYTYTRKNGTFDYCLQEAERAERELCMLFTCEQLFNYYFFYSGNQQDFYMKIMQATRNKGQNNAWIIRQGATRVFNLYKEYLEDKLEIMIDLHSRETDEELKGRLKVGVANLDYLNNKIKLIEPRKGSRYTKPKEQVVYPSRVKRTDKRGFAPAK